MNKVWHDRAWDEYLSWHKEDRKTLKRINSILKDIDRSPFKKYLNV
jgi:toxin YoeB